jgi:hypothetical protein
MMVEQGESMSEQEAQQEIEQVAIEPEIEVEQEMVQEEEPAQEPQAEEPQEEEMVVMIGDEPVEEESQPAPDWVRELRKKNREDQKRIRELEAKLAQTQAPAQIQPGKKPELDDFDYDTVRYEAALADWFDKKRRYDDQLAAQKRAEEEQNQQWQTKLESYAQARTGLKVKDFEDAETTVAEQFNITQQGVVIQGAENPALVIYALGKNPKKLKELSSIADPVKFAFAIAKLETQLKVANKKSAPPPEKVVGGTAPIRGAVDSNLDRLRAEAERTGDYSKVFAYKRQKKA